MSDQLSDDKLDRKVYEYLEKNGSSTHETLTEDLEITWDVLQKSIRRLRSEGKVALTLDRRYEAI